MKVINLRNGGDYDVYMGRRNRKHRDAKLGNPFIIGPHGSRADVIKQFTDWFYSEDGQWYRDECIRVIEQDSVLACWCDPLPCHAHVVMEYMENVVHRLR